MHFVNVVGFLGADPQVLGGKGFKFSVASSVKIPSKTGGEAETKTTWFNVIAFQEFTLFFRQNLKKGAKVVVCGSWESSEYNGKTYYQLKVGGYNSYIGIVKPPAGNDVDQSAAQCRATFSTDNVPY